MLSKILLIPFALIAFGTESYGFDLRSLIEKIPQTKEFLGHADNPQKKEKQGLPKLGNDFESCKSYFFKGKPPIVKNSVSLKARPICIEGFATLYSGANKIPIFSAEVMNRAKLSPDKHQERTNLFFEDARLPRADRSTLKDYNGSGFDRGHNFPAGNSSTPEAMAQSFSLANIMPQAPNNNRQLWEGYESATRKYVKRAQGDVYVITGSIVDSENCTLGFALSGDMSPQHDVKNCTIGNGVKVPTYIYKVVFDSSTFKAWAYWTINADDQKAGPPISYTKIVQRTGIDFFPGTSLN